jgi:hypothetical protein
MAVLFGAAFLLFFRMYVFFFAFLCVFLGGGVLLFASRRGRIFVVIAMTILSVLLIGQTATLGRGNAILRTLDEWFPRPSARLTNYWQNDLDLLTWIPANTDQDQVFAGWIGTTPAIYAYADRPIVLHSKFENEMVREKFFEFMSALFSDEEAMANFCRRYGVDYVVYQADFLLEDSASSARYFAGHQAVPEGSTALKMHFQPFALNDFELVYQNPTYRVFQFLKSPGQQFRNLPIGYEPVFDEQVMMGGRSAWDDEAGQEAYRGVDSLYQGYSAALSALDAGQVQVGKQILLRIVEANPKFYRAWLVLGELAAREGNIDVARHAWEQVLYGHPHHPDAERRLQETEKK